MRYFKAYKLLAAIQSLERWEFISERNGEGDVSRETTNILWEIISSCRECCEAIELRESVKRIERIDGPSLSRLFLQGLPSLENSERRT